MAEVAALVLPIVTDIGKCLVDPVKRQFGYLLFYDRNVENLKTEVEKLEHTRDKIQRRVDVGIKNNETVEIDVEKWLGGVDNPIKEAKRFLEVDVKANKGCLNGLCPNPKSCYSLSRKATKITKDLVELCGKGTGFDSVTYRTPLVEIFKSNGDYRDFPSRNSIMNDVMEALAFDGINIIGICGMGGVGKTTLVKKVVEIIREKKLFEEVVMVAVSQNPDLIKIQGDIAEMLSYTSFGVSSNLHVRAGNLRARILKSKSILVILDDVWKRLELNDIGIPFGDDHKGCKIKIVLTSRDYDVCRNYMDDPQIFQLDVLIEEEAWNLFKEEAGISNDGTGHNIDFLYKEVAKECGRLPIAIVTVARALKGKAEHSWDSALQQLRKAMAKNITELKERVFEVLKWSYNYLGSEEAKKCFLLCSLFPEDDNIPIEAIVRYGIGLKYFEQLESVKEARDRVHDLVDNLKTRNLLMHGENDEKSVKIHDVMRDVAISIAREEHSFMVSCDKPLTDWPMDARRQNYAIISLCLTGMRKLRGDLELPKLQLLQLLCEGEELDTPDNFFEGMKELKVVTFRNMSFRKLPTSLHFLSCLKTLSLSVCKWIDDVSVIGALTNLEILSIANSKIRELPKEIGDLSQLKLLELADCVVGRIIPGVLSSLQKLEELYIGKSFDQWEVVEQGKEGTNANIAELASLSKLVALKICVQLNDVKSWPKVLDLKKLEKFDIIICQPYPHEDLRIEDRIFRSSSTDLYYDFCHFQNQLMFRDVDVSHLMETVLKNLLKRIRVLKLGSVKGSMNIFSGLGRDDFAKLKKLEISYCGDLEYLINTADWVSHTASDALDLEELKLIGLPALTHVWKGPCLSSISLPITKCSRPSRNGGLTQLVSLCNLTSVWVEDCPKLKSMFSISMARHLIQLQSIEIWDCDEMEVIVSSEGGEHEIVPVDKIVFPKLHELDLLGLPSFTALCKDIVAIEMPELETLYLRHIPKLQYLCPRESNHNSVIQSLFHNKGLTQLVSLCNLTRVWVDDCPKLKSMFSISMARHLIQLQSIRIRNCDEMEVIVSSEGGEHEIVPAADKIVFPKVYYLGLGSLPCFTALCKDMIAIEMPELKTLRLEGIPKLQYVCPPESNHNSVIQSLFHNKVNLISIEYLTLLDMDNLIEIWPSELQVGQGHPAIALSCLKKLKLRNLPKLTQGLTGKCDVLDVLELLLKHCADLEYLSLDYFPALTHLWKHPSQFLWLCNLRYLDVRECEKLESVFSLSTENPNKTEVIVSSEGGEHEIVPTNKIVLPKLYELQLQGLPSFTGFYDAPIAIVLPELKKLHLEKIPKLQYLYGASKSNCYGVIQSLLHNQVNLTSIEELRLLDMDNLIEIWPGELQAKLIYLRVRNCQKLPNILFSSNLIECMQNLETIYVIDCQSVEVVFDLGGLDVGEGHPAIALSCLKELELSNLQKLTHVWTNNSVCSQGFQNLISIKVEKCDSLRNLFSPAIAKLLLKLQRLEIIKCEVMEIIITQEQEVDEEVTTNTIIFSQLTHLELEDLPNLTSFCKQDYTIEGSFLEEVKVTRCLKMEALPSALQQLREQYDMHDG